MEPVPPINGFYFFILKWNRFLNTNEKRGIKMDHKKIAREVLDAIGGKENVSAAAHWTTWMS
jgi:hypothetical protein